MFCIDGNIGVGKSTIINLLSKEYKCFLEPVKEWTLLEKFYKNPKEYSFSFQYQILLSQYNQLNEINKLLPEICFVERSAWSSKNVFLKLLFKNKFIKKDEIKVYNKFFNKLDINIKHIFYLHLPPEMCLKRIMKRNRLEEKNIPLSYLESIEKQYKKSFTKTNYNIIIINCLNKNPEEIIKEIKSYII